MNDSSISVARRYEGPTGSGQGGWTSAQFAEQLGEPVTIALRAPIPFDTELTVAAADDRWSLDAPDGTTIMTAERWGGPFADTDAVDLDDASAASARFRDVVGDHPAPDCFSCGLAHDSMGVRAGPLGDGRFATPWTAPEWAVRADGTLDPGVTWAALDCTAAWWVALSRDPRTALTAQYAAEVTEPIVPGATYSVVGWSGDHHAEWDGRKRHAASAMFDADGRCVGRSVSFWISV